MSYLFFDTETTGVPANYNAPVSDSANWPRLVQVGWILFDNDKNRIYQVEHIIRPDGFEIPIDASNVHGITTERALLEGQPLIKVLEDFEYSMPVNGVFVGHNISFDMNIMGAEFFRVFGRNPLEGKRTIDTMRSSTNFCEIPGNYGKYKWPKRTELYRKLFNKDMGAAHTALQDIENTATCYFELVKRGVITE